MQDSSNVIQPCSFERFIEADLIAWANKTNRKPLILKGARQVGKTHSLKKLGKDEFRETHYFNFEKEKKLKFLFESDLSPPKILTTLSLYAGKSIDVHKDLLIFDEIQSCPNALTSLKYFKEEMQSLAVCAAGSLLGIHLAETSFPVGAVDLVNMYPLSFKEYLKAVGEDNLNRFLDAVTLEEPITEPIHSLLWDNLKTYFVIGGLPEVVESFVKNKHDFVLALNAARNTQLNLIQTYLADMAKHSGKQNSMHIERLWSNIPEQLARTQDGSAAKFRFRGVIPGVSAYSRLAGVIDWLEKAGLIIRVKMINKAMLPFSAYADENSFKLYLFDVGILGALSDLPIQSILDYQYGTYKGYIAENFVAQEFMHLGLRQLYSWKEKESELEFVREINGKIIPIEVKSGHVTKSKSLNIFFQKANPDLSIVLSGRAGPYYKSLKKRLYLPLYCTQSGFSVYLKS